MDIGTRIKQLREMKGYSVNKLANKAGVSQTYLRDIELGSKNPTVAFISLLCEQLEISLRDFFSDAEKASFENDPLTQKIYQMTPIQRARLLDFLNSLE